MNRASALAATRTAHLSARQYTLEMPFYGDVLHDLTQQVRKKSQGVIARGEGAPGEFTALIRQMGAEARVSDAEVRAELGQEIVARAVGCSECRAFSWSTTFVARSTPRGCHRRIGTG